MGGWGAGRAKAGSRLGLDLDRQMEGGKGYVQWEGLLGQREEEEERAGRLGWPQALPHPITGQEDSLATGLDTWEGRRALFLSQEGQHALPSHRGRPFL